MVCMLVGNYDGINANGRTAQGLKPAKNFAPANARIKENTGLRGFNQGCITRAA